MPANESIVELVKFTSSGMSEILTDAKKMQELLDRLKGTAQGAAEQQQKLADAVNDAGFREQAGALLAAETAARKLNDATRQRIELEARRQAVATGAYGRDLRVQQTLRREQERVLELERRAQYQARFGRQAGYLAYQADRALRSPGGMAAMAGAAAVTGLAKNGFSNTVEMNRFNLEVQLISRELAGAFKPALDFATSALGKFRKFLERLGSREQDAIMYGGLAVAGYGAYRAGGALLGGAGRMLGMGAAAPAAAAGMGAAEAAAIGAGGAKLLGGGAPAAAVGATPGAGGRLLRGVKGVGKFLGGRVLPIAAAAETISELTDDDGFYERHRRKGGSRFGSAVRTIGDMGLNMLTFGGHAEGLRKDGEIGAAAKTASDRRVVTPADAGFEASGSFSARAATALALVDAGEEGSPKWVADIIETIKSTVMLAAEKARAGKPELR